MRPIASFSVRAARLSGIAALGLLLAAFAVPPATARVHIGLASSSPAKDAHLMKAPSELRLTFTGPIDVTKAGVELVGADSASVSLSPLESVADSSRVAVARIRGKLVGGTYTVRWHAIAADGAAGNGSFSFMYMAPME